MTGTGVAFARSVPATLTAFCCWRGVKKDSQVLSAMWSVMAPSKLHWIYAARALLQTRHCVLCCTTNHAITQALAERLTNCCAAARVQANQFWGNVQLRCGCGNMYIVANQTVVQGYEDLSSPCETHDYTLTLRLKGHLGMRVSATPLTPFFLFTDGRKPSVSCNKAKPSI